jgi:hypothetical protein
MDLERVHHTADLGIEERGGSEVGMPELPCGLVVHRLLKTEDRRVESRHIVVVFLNFQVAVEVPVLQKIQRVRSEMGRKEWEDADKAF